MTELPSSRAAPAAAVHLTYGCDDPIDVVDALALQTFLSGTQPWARTARLARTRPDASLLPAGVGPDRQALDNGRSSVLAHGDGWSAHVQRWADGTAAVTVVAVTDRLAESTLQACVRDADEPVGTGDDLATVAFWYLFGHNPRRLDRVLKATPWPAIRRNYSRRVAAAFDRLMNLDPATMSGRLLLVHGPAGTGKTTALRALAQSWRPWCQFHYIVDPERLFREPGYLLGVSSARTAGSDDDEEGPRRPQWQLLVLEDCDELIGADAKQSSGQSLARLLNMTDGMLGQGLNLLIAVTTNEPLSRLHPAVSRPGRCLAEIEVGRLSAIEASQWLGRPAAVGTEGATLAELFALAAGGAGKIQEDRPALRAGLYL